jgi:hypothetical protein
VKKAAKVGAIAATVLPLAAVYVLQTQTIFKPDFLAANGFRLRERLDDTSGTPSTYRTYASKIPLEQVAGSGWLGADTLQKPGAS